MGDSARAELQMIPPPAPAARSAKRGRSSGGHAAGAALAKRLGAAERRIDALLEEMKILRQQNLNVLVTEVAKIESGEIEVGRAKLARRADTATSAETAKMATVADTARTIGHVYITDVQCWCKQVHIPYLHVAGSSSCWCGDAHTEHHEAETGVRCWCGTVHRPYPR